MFGGWCQGNAPLRHVQVGDTVLLVVGHRQRLHLLGALAVETTGPLEDLGNSPHGLATWRVAGHWLLPFTIDRMVPTSWLHDWTFVNADGRPRPVSHVEDGRLLKNHAFQGTFRVQAATAARVATLWDTPEHQLSEDTLLAELEERRWRAPDDRDLAEVHQDALFDRGDVRAEALAVELAGARSKRAHLERLASAHPALLGRPGGFPFRIAWAPPKQLR